MAKRLNPAIAELIERETKRNPILKRLAEEDGDRNGDQEIAALVDHLRGLGVSEEAVRVVLAELCAVNDDLDDEAFADKLKNHKISASLSLAELGRKLRRTRHKRRFTSIPAASFSTDSDRPPPALTRERAKVVADELIRNPANQAGNAMAHHEENKGTRNKIAKLIKQIQVTKDGKHDAPTATVTDEELASQVLVLDPDAKGDLSWSEFLSLVREVAKAEGFFDRATSAGAQVPRYVDAEASLSLTPRTTPGQMMSDARRDAVVNAMLSASPVR